MLRTIPRRRALLPDAALLRRAPHQVLKYEPVGNAIAAAAAAARTPPASDGHVPMTTSGRHRFKSVVGPDPRSESS